MKVKQFNKPLLEATEKVSVGWDNEAGGTELGRLHLVNNRNEYRSNKISTLNGAFSVASLVILALLVRCQEQFPLIPHPTSIFWKVSWVPLGSTVLAPLQGR